MFTQTTPFLQLITPTADNFIVSDFTGSETISQLFEYRLTIYSDNLHITAENFINHNVTLLINDSQDNSSRIFNGIIGNYKAGPIENNLRQYVLKIVPSLWRLKFITDCRIFKNQTVSQIVQTLCQEQQIKLDASKLRGNYVPREYCVQYQETTLNFIQRLLEEEEIFYCFQHEKNQHRFVLLDKLSFCQATDPASIPYSVGGLRDHHISRWGAQYNFYSGQYLHTDYDFTKPNTSLLTRQSSQAKLPIANEYSLFNYPGNHSEISQGKEKAQKRFAADEALHHVMSATSNCGGLRAAIRFSLTDYPDAKENQDYVVLSITHSAMDYSQLTAQRANAISQNYSNQFTCLSADVDYRPVLSCEKPCIVGHQTATVVGDSGQEIDVDNYGRVQVHFPWDREHKISCRLRVAQNWAGQGWGTIFHPRVGQEVVVSFENGDPDRPIVIGSAYNANNMPPYDLPANHTQSGFKSRSTKQAAASEANELRFEDRKGQEEIYLHAQKDHTRVVENNELTTVNRGDQVVNVAAGKSSLEAAQSILFKVGSNSIQLTPDGVFINSSNVKINQ